MAFVNEYITEQDRQKYGLDAIDGSPAMKCRAPDRSWTIDHDRSMYLRFIDRGREEFHSHSTWHLYWHGELLIVELALLGGSGDRGQPGTSHWKVRELKLPPHIENRRDEVLHDLKEALTAYKDGGVFSKNTSYSVVLDA